MNKSEASRHVRSEQRFGSSPSVLNPVLPKAFANMLRIDRSEEIIDRHFNVFFGEMETQNNIYWLGKFEQYSSLPKDKKDSKGKTPAENFVVETARELLKNPQDINFMQDALRIKENNAADEDSKQQFVRLVKNNCLTLINHEWKDVMPGQLANLVRIYANDNDPSKDFAKKMLTEFFKGPPAKPDRPYPRMVARLKFVTALLDLVGEDDAFLEGMKIDLFATDILPRDPSFIEQTSLLSLPSKKEEKEGHFKMLLIIECVAKQAMSVSSQDFTKYIRDNEYFLKHDETIKKKIKKDWEERKERVTREIGSPTKAAAKNDAVRAAMSVFLHFLREPLTEEKKQQLIGRWPFDEAFDQTHPLNQKFERVLSENRSRSVKNVNEDPQRIVAT